MAKRFGSSRHCSLAHCATLSSVTLAMILSGCAIPHVQDQKDAISGAAKDALKNTPQSRPVARVHSGAWLMGEKVPATKAQPDIYDKHVAFNSSKPMSLKDIATWMATEVGVPVDVEASAYVPLPAQSTVTTGTSNSPSNPMPAGGLVGPLPAGPGPFPGSSPLNGLSTSFPGGNSSTAASAAQSTAVLKYSGKLRGFLDVVNASYHVWSRYRDGRVAFFRTETRTFAMPSLPDASTMSGVISTGAGGGASATAGAGSSGGAGSTGGGASGSGASGQSMSLSVGVTPWKTLQATATAIAGAPVIVDENLGTMTVTGTPAQCDRVEAWVKELNAMFGKRIAIDVNLYQVRTNSEDNYGLNLKLAYTNKSGHAALSMTSASAPTVVSAATPMTFGANILSGPLAGSSAAVQALSTLGDVAMLVSDSGVTQNGKQLGLQSATLKDYVQSSQTTLTASVGSTTALQTATVVVGFTGSFIPKLVNGQIVVAFDMTLSDLLPLEKFESGGAENRSSVQLRTMPLARFQQVVPLKPGESLVLTGMRQQTASVTKNGVLTPGMPLLGGGVDAQKNDTVLAVVISARLL